MIKFDNSYFNIEDTLYCGQVFRFKKILNGYLVMSQSEACRLYYEGDLVVIDSSNDEYFANYFDLNRDYSIIYDKAINSGFDYLALAAKSAKGIRILRQDKLETIISFIISQNNNIPRIKRAIEGLCEKFGIKCEFKGQEYFAFPSLEKLKTLSIVDFQNLGTGYRAKYLYEFIKKIDAKTIQYFSTLDESSLTKELCSYIGIGKKVCDCIKLFAFSMTNSFPVDTWIAKLCKENFLKEEMSREKMSEYFSKIFGEYSGFFQQYLFYYKRGK